MKDKYMKELPFTSKMALRWARAWGFSVKSVIDCSLPSPTRQLLDKPVTLKYCSASATLVGNTLLIKRPNVLVPIHSADSLALNANINKLDTKQPI